MWPFEKKKSLMESGLLEGATDRHSHILYGVDDGIPTLDESLHCISLYEHAGLSDLWLTPHVMEDIPNSTDRLKTRFEELVTAYVPEGESYDGKVRLHLAAEYMLDMEFAKRLDAGDLLTMENRTVLVETSTWAPPVDLYSMLEKTRRSGYNPLLAHVERYHYMKPEDYDRLRDMGIRMQLNYGSLVGGYGENSQKRARLLLEKGYYDCIGSDCHRLSFIRKSFGEKTLKKSELASIEPLLRKKQLI